MPKIADMDNRDLVKIVEENFPFASFTNLKVAKGTITDKELAVILQVLSEKSEIQNGIASASQGLFVSSYQFPIPRDKILFLEGYDRINLDIRRKEGGEVIAQIYSEGMVKKNAHQITLEGLKLKTDEEIFNRQIERLKGELPYDPASDFYQCFFIRVLNGQNIGAFIPVSSPLPNSMEASFVRAINAELIEKSVVTKSGVILSRRNAEYIGILSQTSLPDLKRTYYKKYI